MTKTARQKPAPMEDKAIHNLRRQIVELSRKNEAIHKGFAFFENLIDEVPFACAVIDPEGRVILANAALGQIFHRKAEDIIGVNIFESADEDIKARIKAKRGIINKKRMLYDEMKVNIEGQAIWLQILGIISRLDDSMIVCGMTITGRKYAELELQKRAIQLQQVVESLNDGILKIDGEGCTTFVNSRMADMLGYTVEEMVGRPLFTFIDEGARRLTEEKINRRKRGIRERYDCTYLKKDGTPVILSASVTPVYDQDGTYAGAVGVMRDVTEERELGRTLWESEQRYRHLAQRLEGVNKELEAFTYSVSHDLRAPLRHIDGLCQAFLEDYDERIDEEGREYLRLIKDSAVKARLLIDDLLRLSHIGKYQMDYERFDISAMAHDINNELKKKNPERDIVIRIMDGLAACGDKKLIRIALANLFDNAWKYSANRRRAVIEFGVSRREGRVEFFVRDNGIGFDIGFADTLFMPFQRLHLEDEYPGTGIGLAIVQRILHRHHGGYIRAESKIGEGAAFYFRLPDVEANARKEDAQNP